MKSTKKLPINGTHIFDLHDGWRGTIFLLGYLADEGTGREIVFGNYIQFNGTATGKYRNDPKLGRQRLFRDIDGIPGYSGPNAWLAPLEEKE